MKVLIVLGLCLVMAAHLFVEASSDDDVTVVTLREARSTGDDEEEGNDEIIGGTAANIRDFPSLGFLGITVGGSVYTCGGTLFRSNYIITAAHCLKGASAVSAVFNSTSRAVGTGAIRRSAVKYAIHGAYSGTTLKNDIALIKLNSPVTTLRSVTVGTAATGATATIAGWGTTTVGGPVSQTLMRATVSVLDNALCSSKYAGTVYSPINSGQVCAAAPGKDTCQGDSGGPIYVGTAQVGVTSFGIGCADSRYPGVYTRLSAYTTWLTAAITAMG